VAQTAQGWEPAKHCVHRMFSLFRVIEAGLLQLGQRGRYAWSEDHAGDQMIGQLGGKRFVGQLVGIYAPLDEGRRLFPDCVWQAKKTTPRNISARMELFGLSRVRWEINSELDQLLAGLLQVSGAP
jgi:hypothetical protein